MAATRKPPARKAPARKRPASKPKTPVVKHMNVYAVPIIEIDISARCCHGCFFMTPMSVVVFNFFGIGNRIDVGPGGDQADICIHHHTGLPGEEDCESDCWGVEGDE